MVESTVFYMNTMESQFLGLLEIQTKSWKMCSEDIDKQSISHMNSLISPLIIVVSIANF